MHHTPLIATVVVGLVLAFGLGLLAHRFKISPLVGYLLAGVAMGPFTPGYVADLDPSQREALVKTGLLDTVGEDRVVWRDPVLGAAAAEASRRGQAWISGHHTRSDQPPPPV